MKGFLKFIRKQGIIGLAIGFVLGGAVTKVVSSLVNDIFNPVLNGILGLAGSFEEATLQVGSISIKWGNFVNTLLDFLMVALLVYITSRFIRIDSARKTPKAK